MGEMFTNHRGAKEDLLSSDSTLHVLERAQKGDRAAART
jgi:hypothetical protein